MRSWDMYPLVAPMSQYDLPPQTLLQQSSARPVSGEELETYGKHAADAYGRGDYETLSEAIVDTVKTAGLSPAQVQRVVEFTNTAAFLTEFNKEGAASKYVVFNGGPARFNEVIQDLNDGGGGTVFDRGILDYSHTPDVKTASRKQQALEKTAAAEADDVLARAFRVECAASPLPYANPLADVHDLCEKLAAARDGHTAQINELELDLSAVSEEMYQHVKQAALEGVSLGSVVQAWDLALQPDPVLVKAAFALMGPRLQADVFGSWNALGASFEKTAAVGAMVNAEQPIVVAFDAYCDLVTKLAHLRAAQGDMLAGIDQLQAFERSVARNYSEVVA